MSLIGSVDLEEGKGSRKKKFFLDFFSSFKQFFFLVVLPLTPGHKKRLFAASLNKEVNNTGVSYSDE